MSGFNSNYFNRHLINDMRNALNSVFIEEEKTSARNLQQSRERLDSDRAERRARGQEINAAKRERTAQINAETAKTGDRNKAMDTLNKSVDFQRLSGTASRGQGQQNTFGGENQRTETGSGVSRMARGADGRPVSSYVNKTTGAQARVNADVESGKLPASFGQYQGNRLPMDLAKEREDAGNAAFDTSVKNDLGITNASGMSRSDLESKARDVARGNIETELNSGKQLSANNPDEFDKQYPSISITDPAGVAKAYAARIASTSARSADADARSAYAAKRSADADARLDAANTALSNSAAASKASPAAKQIDNSGEVDRQRNADYNRQRKDGALSIPGTSNFNTGTEAPAAQTTSTPAARAAPKLSPAAEQEKQKAYDNWNSGKSGNPKGTPNDSVSRQVGYDVESSRNRTSEALRQSQRAEELANKSRGSNPIAQPTAPTARPTVTPAAPTRPAAQPAVPVYRPINTSNRPSGERDAAKRLNDLEAPPENKKSPNKVMESNLPMWNGTIGPNGGQQANPAGAKKPTLKVENTVKPKTPPQTFFPMR